MQLPTYFILAALADGRPRHGYALIAEVLELSGGETRLSAGTLYGSLERLAGAGFVRVAREEVVRGRARRYYGLTPEGADALASEAERMRRAAEVATVRLPARHLAR